MARPEALRRACHPPGMYEPAVRKCFGKVWTNHPHCPKINLSEPWAMIVTCAIPKSCGKEGPSMASSQRLVIPLFVAFLAFPAAVAAEQLAPRDADAAVAFFEKKVRPVLVNNCYNCHSANTNAKGGLRVDDRNGLLQGGSSGPAVVPGQPEKSLLLQAVRHAAITKLKMPPEEAALGRADRRPDEMDQGRGGLAQGRGCRSPRQAATPNTTSCARSTGPGSRCRDGQGARGARRGVAARRHRPVHPGQAGSERASSPSATRTG